MQNELNFARYRTAIASLLDRSASLLADADLTTPAQADRLEKAGSLLHSDAKLRVSLLGEYSAGKSSLINALTGADAAIDADVETTSTETYEWKGIEWVDTPGIQSQAEATDHDEIARKATVDTDLVVFVVTSHGFNDRLADYFEYVAGDDGLALASKMCLVVNKIDQQDAPVEHIIADIEATIAPHNDMPIQPAALRDYLKADEVPPRLQGKLRERSRMAELRATLEEFADETGAIGRLTRPLQLLEALIEEIRNELAGDDATVRSQLEFMRRQRRTVQKEMAELNSKERTWKSNVRSTVLQDVDEVTDVVDTATTAEEIEEAFEMAMRRAGTRLEDTYGSIEDELRQWATGLRDKLEALDGSDLGASVLDGISSQSNVDPGTSFEDTAGGSFDFVRASKHLVDGVLSDFLQKAASDPGWMRDTVYRVGKKLGKKFKPWEAVKKSRSLSKFFGRASKALPVVAAALEWWANWREEKARKERERQKAKARLTIRRQFHNLADAQADALAGSLDELRDNVLGPMLDDIDNQVDNLVARETREQEFAQRLAELAGESRELQTEIPD